MASYPELVKMIATGEDGFEAGSAIRALACEVVRLETLLRRVHPGLFADEDDTQSTDVQRNS